MHKKIITLLLIFCFAFAPTAVFANTDSDANEIPMSKYFLISENMQINLPDGWYFNTPDEIDEDFLAVTENTERKLEKFLSKNNVRYNLVSKDLKEEINVVTQHNSQTKAMFDFNLIDENTLKERAQMLVDLGAQEDDGITTTYTSYSVEKINQCVFTVFNGTIEDENGKTDFIQYTTTINGYGITISYRGAEGSDLAAGEVLIRQVVESFNVTEVIETELKKEVYKQMLTPIAIAGGFILITATLIIRQIIKNKKEKKAEKENN